MLDVFLKVGVYPAVGGADFVGETAHAVDVRAAQEKGHRHDEDHDKGEAPVHGAEEEEGAEQLEARRYDGRHSARQRVRHLRHIAVKSAEHISCMKGFPTKPAALHDLCEVSISQ